MAASRDNAIRPAMLTDDIAFVGDRSVSVHAILTGEGIVLLDTGFPGMLEGIGESLKALGLSLADVTAVVHTHGHIDHYGNTAAIARLTGAKTYIGREDADIVTGGRDLSWAKELGLDPAETFTPSAVFSDGDVLTFGERKIRAVHAPGHTEGTYAFFIESKAGGVPVTAAMHGGVGLNSMTRAFLLSRGLPLSLRDDFRRGLRKLAAEKVDVVLGNHPQQNDTEGKIARMGKGEDPFVDPDEWKRFLRACEENLDRMLAEEEKEEQGSGR